MSHLSGHVLPALLRRRTLQLVLAGALVATSSAAVAIDASASDTETDGEPLRPIVQTVSVTPADRVELQSTEGELADALAEALEARQQLVATAPPPPPPPAPEPEPEPAPAPAPAPEPEPEPEPAPAPAVSTSGPISEATWDAVAQCESGGNWSINTGNGYYGGLQFNLNSWQWVGGTGMPHEASRETQIAMAQRLWERQGWNAWPACSSKLGLR
jgi:hypothetical protein